MRSDDGQILIFARYPVAGQAKTRLIPALGPEGAARLHRRMTEHVVDATRSARETTGAGVTVWFTGARRRDFRAWLGGDIHYESQPSGDLGVRMGRAFETSLGNGSEAVVAIGTDLPELTPEILSQAFEYLRANDIVLGPAMDGGYYLLGMKRFHPGLFQAIDWGTEHVYDQTRVATAGLGLSSAELPRRGDIDRGEDLVGLDEDPRFTDVFTGKASISVIIPTLNEAEALGRVLERVNGADIAEVIVVDGGSRDATGEIARRSGAWVMEASGDRAAQQNTGAAAASGRLLLFLHGDTLPPDGFTDLIRRTLDDPSTVAGAFGFKTDNSGQAMRPIELLTNFRSRVLQMPYGDQGLFMEKRVFDEMGGFAPLPIMEDFEFIRRLRRRGTVVTLQNPAVTSARRWRSVGVLRTTIINQIMIAGFFAGVPIHTLERFYRNQKVKNHKKKNEPRRR